MNTNAKGVEQLVRDVCTPRSVLQLSFDYIVGYADEGPSCPLCSSKVDLPFGDFDEAEPWLGTCRHNGHTGLYALDEENNEGEWLEDSAEGRFSRIASGPTISTWVCNHCGECEADPFRTGCVTCGAEPDVR